MPHIISKIPGVIPRWWEQAVCQGTQTEAMFVPIDADNERAPLDRTVAAMCRNCPVRRSCIIEGLVINDRSSVRGGWRFWNRHDRHRARTEITDLVSDPQRVRHDLGFNFRWEDEDGPKPDTAYRAEYRRRQREMQEAS